MAAPVESGGRITVHTEPRCSLESGRVEKWEALEVFALPLELGPCGKLMNFVKQCVQARAVRSGMICATAVDRLEPQSMVHVRFSVLSAGEIFF